MRCIESYAIENDLIKTQLTYIVELCFLLFRIFCGELWEFYKNLLKNIYKVQKLCYNRRAKQS